MSSANLAAVEYEWETYKLTDYLSGMFAQEAGTKEHCLAHLKQYYNLEDIIMLGDAKGDLEAAESHGMYFYPILAGHEDQSWLDFNNKYLKLFKDGHFNQYTHDTLKQIFLIILKERTNTMVKVDLTASPYHLNDNQIAWVEETLGTLTDEEKLVNYFLTYFL